MTSNLWEEGGGRIFKNYIDPPSRVRLKGLQRLLFKPNGELELYGERFIHYRLCAKDMSQTD